MVSSTHIKKIFPFVFSIYLALTLLTTTILITSNQITFTNDESSTKGFNTQIPRESAVYYEDTTGFAYGVYVRGDYAYVADWGSGLAIIDISDPTNPTTVDYEDTTGNARGVYVDGDFAYVADDASGLAVINISDPTNPTTVDYEDTTGSAYCVSVSGDYAYVADGFSGLAVMNISDPTNPTTVVYEDTTGFASGVYVRGDYAYVADWGSGLAIIDISDPTNPTTIVYEDSTGWAYDVYVSGDYAYVADYESGLAVINISNPTNPGTPVYENTTNNALGVHVRGSYAYVADDKSGLAVIDISDPTNPGTPIYEDTTGSPCGIYLSGDYAYIADHFRGLAVIDISNTTSPTITNIPNDLTVEYAYTGQNISWTAIDPEPNIYTIKLDGTEVVLATTWTNGTTIEYNIPDGFAVGVYVYTVNFTDDYGNYIIDSVTFTVGDTTSPTITNIPSDLTVEFGYSGQNITWTTTDLNSNTYTIELDGTEVVSTTIWTNGTPVVYNIPDGFTVGVYYYTITFTDDYGNFITDNVTFTVEDIDTTDNKKRILVVSFGIALLISISIVATVIIVKKKKNR